VNVQLEKIRKKLGHLTMEWQENSWLDTGVPDLNQVLGHRERGIPYGRIMEVSGLESQGKTALVLSLAALAQRDDAGIVWADFENSFDEQWAVQRGLDPASASLVLIQPYVGTFSGEKEPRMATAQEICAEAEMSLAVLRKKHKKLLLAIDSIPSMLTDGEAVAGLEGHNMRISMDLPMFLSRLMRRWVGLAQSQNALVILVNQLRQSPATRYGDPWYTPGGNAVRFYSHIRVRLRRAKGGRLLKKGKQVGIQGIITNHKNKAGGLERSTVGYKLLFDGPIQFVSASSLERDEDE
jgi:recombination protein RecA